MNHIILRLRTHFYSAKNASVVKKGVDPSENIYIFIFTNHETLYSCYSSLLLYLNYEKCFYWGRLKILSCFWHILNLLPWQPCKSNSKRGSQLMMLQFLLCRHVALSSMCKSNHASFPPFFKLKVNYMYVCLSVFILSYSGLNYVIHDLVYIM